jgi:hypothetical protein
MRYQLAWNHDVCRGVVAVFVRAVLGCLRARALDGGVLDGRGGAVAVIQRFGGALNLNVPIHALVLVGVFAMDGAGALNFHPAPPLTALAQALALTEPVLVDLDLSFRSSADRIADRSRLGKTGFVEPLPLRCVDR